MFWSVFVVVWGGFGCFGVVRGVFRLVPSLRYEINFNF